jgi:hypothetical protein
MNALPLTNFGMKSNIIRDLLRKSKNGLKMKVMKNCSAERSHRKAGVNDDCTSEKDSDLRQRAHTHFLSTMKHKLEFVSS